MPEQLTICIRTFHYTFVFPKFSYAFAFFFGSLLPVIRHHLIPKTFLGWLYKKKITLHLPPKTSVAIQDWSDMDEGWLYGEWETGPWWAFHTKVGLLVSELSDCHVSDNWAILDTWDPRVKHFIRVITTWSTPWLIFCPTRTRLGPNTTRTE